MGEASQRVKYDYYVVEGLFAVLGHDVEESWSFSVGEIELMVVIGVYFGKAYPF